MKLATIVRRLATFKQRQRLRKALAATRELLELVEMERIVVAIDPAVTAKETP